MSLMVTVPTSTTAPIQPGLSHVLSSPDIRVRQVRGGRTRDGRKSGSFRPGLPVCARGLSWALQEVHTTQPSWFPAWPLGQAGSASYGLRTRHSQDQIQENRKGGSCCWPWSGLGPSSLPHLHPLQKQAGGPDPHSQHPPGGSPSCLDQRILS